MSISYNSTPLQPYILLMYPGRTPCCIAHTRSTRTECGHPSAVSDRLRVIRLCYSFECKPVVHMMSKSSRRTSPLDLVRTGFCFGICPVFRRRRCDFAHVTLGAQPQELTGDPTARLYSFQYSVHTRCTYFTTSKFHF